MDLDELDPRKPASKPKDLSNFSVEDLRAYVALLKEEIARAENAIAAKTAHKDAAASIFKR
jgi:uncharacterized small protein (DUF1192 family)